MANPLVSMGAPLAKPVSAANMNMDAIRQAAQSAKRMMGMLQAVKNPMAVIQQIPELNAVCQMCNGRNMEQVFYEECKKKGVDPNIIINELRS